MRIGSSILLSLVSRLEECRSQQRTPLPGRCGTASDSETVWNFRYGNKGELCPCFGAVRKSGDENRWWMRQNAAKTMLHPHAEEKKAAEVGPKDRMCSESMRSGQKRIVF